MSSQSERSTELEFALSYELRGALPIIRVCGELDIPTAPQLKSMVGDALNNGARSIAFDFSRLGFIDSCGLAVLMPAQKRVVQRGGQVYILGAYGHTRRVFSLINLGRIFRFCSEAELPAEEPAESAPAAADDATGDLSAAPV